MANRRAKNRKSYQSRQAARGAKLLDEQSQASKRGSGANIFNWLSSNPTKCYYDHPDWFQIVSAHEGTGDAVDLMVKRAESVRACQRKLNSGDTSDWRDAVRLAELGMSEMLCGGEIREGCFMGVVRLLLFQSTAHVYLGEETLALKVAGAFEGYLKQAGAFGYESSADPLASVILWGEDVKMAALEADGNAPRVTLEGIDEPAAEEDEWVTDDEGVEVGQEVGAGTSLHVPGQSAAIAEKGIPSYGHVLNISTSSSNRTELSEGFLSEVGTSVTSVGSAEEGDKETDQV